MNNTLHTKTQDHLRDRILAKNNLKPNKWYKFRLHFIEQPTKPTKPTKPTQPTQPTKPEHINTCGYIRRTNRSIHFLTLTKLTNATNQLNSKTNQKITTNAIDRNITTSPIPTVNSTNILVSKFYQINGNYLKLLETNNHTASEVYNDPFLLGHFLILLQENTFFPTNYITCHLNPCKLL